LFPFNWKSAKAEDWYIFAGKVGLPDTYQIETGNGEISGPFPIVFIGWRKTKRNHLGNDSKNNAMFCLFLTNMVRTR
jgi:hypothetical protein